MTVKQAARKLKSLYFRQRLLEDLPVLESEVMEFIEETGMKVFAGFKVEVEKGKLRLTKVQVNSKQLRLKLEREVENESQREN